MVEIPGYQLDEQIYESHISVVYRGRQAGGDQLPVVVKMLNRRYPDVQDRARLNREYDLLRRIDSDGIPTPYEVVQVGNTAGLVMEYLGAKSLRQQNLAGKVEVTGLLGLVGKLAGILGDVHAARVVHKDISPANILWDRDAGVVKLVDFNIAEEVVASTNSILSAGVLEGTLAYMSPEQTGRMNRSVDSRSDFYALGVTMYELAAGRLPFEHADAMELVHAHIARQPPPPNHYSPDLPETLSALIMKLMSKRAENRYQTAAGLLEDVRECLGQLERSGRISPFELGRVDRSQHFRLSETLYGRQEQLGALRELYDGVRDTGQSALALVAGKPGSGKTCLVSELYSHVVSSQGYFVSGKFHNADQTIPYASVIRAFRDLAQQLLISSKEKLAVWRERLLGALGTNAGVVAGVIPDIELLLGPQPPVAELPPAESQNRFNYTFLKFVTAVAGGEHPLVLFLDDLQWADSGSLRLLELMLTDPEIRSLMVIGSYRSDEVGEWHPLTQVLERIRRVQDRVVSLELQALDARTVARLLSDTFLLPEEITSSLAGACVVKTGGNPFFVGQFLHSLHEEGAIWYGRESGRWEWSFADVEGMEITDNVVDLMCGKIVRLAPGTQRTLEIAACIGRQFDAQVIAAVTGDSQETALAGLQEAVQGGLVMAAGTSLPLAMSEGHEGTTVVPRDYRFAHDRIREAAYSLLSEAEKRKLHLHIGRALRTDVADSEGSKLFRIVGHLNTAVELLTDEPERVETARLNLMAGQRSKRALATATAQEYLAKGISLLPQSAWENHYDLAFALHIEMVECAQLNRDEECIARFGDIVLEQSRTVPEKLRVYEARIGYRHSLRDLEGAVGLCLEGLRMVDVKIPRKPGIPQILKAFAGVRLKLRGVNPADFVGMKEMTDPSAMAAMRLVRAGSHAAFFIEPNLIPLMSFKLVEISARFGVSPISALGLSAYAFVLLGPFKKSVEGLAHAAAGLRLAGRYPPQQAGYANFVHYMFCHHWSEPVGESVPYAEAAYLAAMEGGNVEAGMQCRHLLAIHQFWAGIALPEVVASLDENMTIMNKYRHDWFLWFTAGIRYELGRLVGDPPPVVSGTGKPFDPEAHLASANADGDRASLGVRYSLGCIADYVLGDFERALELGGQAALHEEAMIATLFEPFRNMFHALAALAVVRRDPTRRKGRIPVVNKALKRLRRFSRLAPMNFNCMLLLVEAEVQRNGGNPGGAVAVFEQALAGARQAGYSHLEAICCERMAEAFSEAGIERAAELYRFDAYYAYRCWGATRKVDLMEEQFPQLAERMEDGTVQMDREAFISTLTGTTDRGERRLDLETIVKSSQAISGEIVLESLIRKMMRIVVENAGAQRGCLLMDRGGQWALEIECDLDQNETNEEQPTSRTGSGAKPLPLSQDILHYVMNTRKHVVLDDAAKEGDFVRDPYVQASRPKSVLCVPLNYRGKLNGIIYLENNHSTHAFTEQRVVMIGVLSSQISISLENALLFKNKEDLITAYERFVPREFLGFLKKESIVDVELGDQVEEEMTVLFSDIRRFTELSEKMTPQENFNFINSYLSAMEPVIGRHKGFIDKYIGDAIMALFPVGADQAVSGAVEMYRELTPFNQERESFGLEPINIGIGINSGRLMLGTVGGRNRMDGTVISDAVNLAARIEGLTKVFGASVLISEHTYAKLKDPSKYALRAVARVRVKGKTEPVTVFEVFGGEAEEVVKLKTETLPYFRKGLDLYRRQDFDAARTLFNAVCEDNPNDKAARVYIERCSFFLLQGMPQDWDGVEDMV